jgi:hypothetical protein
LGRLKLLQPFVSSSQLLKLPLRLPLLPIHQLFPPRVQAPVLDVCGELTGQDSGVGLFQLLLPNWYGGLTCVELRLTRHKGFELMLKPEVILLLPLLQLQLLDDHRLLLLGYGNLLCGGIGTGLSCGVQLLGVVKHLL